MPEKILIAVVAASATLLGVVISQAISLWISHLHRKHERHVLLRNKYEEMMFHFSNSLQWMVHLNNALTKEEIFSRSQSPDARKALSLCLLYFPDLVNDANKYILAMQAFYNFAVGVFDSAVPHNAGAQALVHGKGKELVGKLFESKVQFENSIVQNAPKYTKA